MFRYNQKPKDAGAPPIIVGNIPIYLFYFEYASLVDK